MTFVPSDHEHAPKVSATPARQGRWGRHVVWVLTVSFLLAAVAMGAAWWAQAGHLQAANDKEQAHIANAPPTMAPHPSPVKQGVPDNASGTFGSTESTRTR